MGEFQYGFDPDLPDEFVVEIEMALMADNGAEVDRLVAELTHNRVRGIDLQSYQRWRGIARGDFIGDLSGAIYATLTDLGWRPAHR